MSDVVISVENLGKRYLVGHNATQTEPADFRELIGRNVSSLVRRTRDMLSGRPLVQGDEVEEFWALKNVSFDVERGETLGIIGSNGAGKSTLLKVLSRITEPTTGRVRISGRVASLLEVGTGFHPELSGRENIFLNGAILGMSRREIQNKLDEIIAFAEVDKFVDTPVKRYSSGMYIRLAFAVSAHLEPEILIVDEVLAVGDARFQKKCLGKMEVLGKEGRSVIFVSHNVGAIAGLCTRSVLLSQGNLVMMGPSAEVLRQYIDLDSNKLGEIIWPTFHDSPGSNTQRLHSVRIRSDEKVTGDVDIDQEVHIEIEFWNLNAGASITTSIHLSNAFGVVVLASSNMHSANTLRDEWYGRPCETGLYRAVCTIPANFLNEGTYSINAIVLTDVTSPQIYAKDIISFTVHETGEMRKEYSGIWIGVVRPRLAWHTTLSKRGVPDVES